MISKNTRSKNTVALDVATVVLLSVSTCLPAAAQNWSYSPYTGASNWLWIARSLVYPLNRYSGYNAPYYLANSLLYTGTYAASQAITRKNRQLNYGTYEDEEPFYDPRQRTRPIVNDGTGVTDQVVHASRMPNNDAMPVPVTGQNDDGFEPQPQQDVAPPVAPDYGYRNPGNFPRPAQPSKRAQKRSKQSAKPLGSQSSPLAQGFIELVNTRYDGDIQKALFDADTRSYAKAIGLIKPDEVFDADLSNEKVQTIRGILADNAEDPMVRIMAVRMLLKH